MRCDKKISDFEWMRPFLNFTFIDFYQRPGIKSSILEKIGYPDQQQLLQLFECNPK
jgi:hypothetical protein